MLRFLAANWWVVLLRGIIFVLFGILALVNPGITAGSIALWLGIVVMVDGVLALVEAAVGGTGDESRWLVALEGVIGVVLGLLILRNPGAVLLGVALLFAGWMIFAGVLKVALAIHLRKEITGEFWLGLAGVCSVVAGLIVAASPGLGLLTLLILIGIFALIYGVLQISLGLRLRALRGRSA